MITDKDRSFYFGASDTSNVVGNRETATFKSWWLEKLGLRSNTLETKYMRAGNLYEGKILDTIPGIRKDHQILIPELRLRVNFDGDKGGVIYEVKTHKSDNPYKLPKAHWRQAQVEMFAMQTDQLYILSYPLDPEHYKNYFREIDPDRIERHKVERDELFLEEYLEKLKYLCNCLERGKMPKNGET